MPQVKVSGLKRAYEKRKNDKDIIRYQSFEFVPDYLKYLLQYVDGREYVNLTSKGGET
jgi:hypothetical protein